MSLYVYSVWIHKLNEFDYYAYCPQFLFNYVISSSFMNAYVSLNDVLIAILNNMISLGFALPNSEDFSNIPDNLKSGIHSPTVLLMPFRVNDGLDIHHDDMLYRIIFKNNILQMPIEVIRFPVEISEDIIEHPEYDGFGLPELQPINTSTLGEEIKQIVSIFNPEYTLGTEISDKREIEDFLTLICDETLKKVHALVHEYSQSDLLSYYIPQRDLITYFYGRANYEMKRSSDPLNEMTDLDKQYHNSKRKLRSIFSFGLNFLISYVVSESPNGLKKLSPDMYDKLIALSYLYVHFRRVQDTFHAVGTTTSIKIVSQGIHEVEASFSDEWFDNYGISMLENEMEILEEQFNDPQHLAGESNPILLKRYQRFDSLNKDIDSAFYEEFGVTLQQVKEFDLVLNLIRMDHHWTICVGYVEKIVTMLQDRYGWDREVIDKLFAMFTLPKRRDWHTIPKGYDDADIDPNNPFGGLQIHRKPFIKIIGDDGDDLILWGLRARSRSFQYFLSRIHDGKYPAVSPGLKAWISKYSEKQGMLFRDAVYLWFNEYCTSPKYKVEVTEIKLKKLFKQVGDLGDIDVVVCDLENNIVYSIECKKITHPRMPTDIRNEFDRFGIIFDNNKQNNFFKRHNARHVNLNSSPNVIQARLKLPKPPKTVSLIITSDVIMSQYTGASPIPIYCYKDLMIKGVSILDEACNHPFNV